MTLRSVNIPAEVLADMGARNPFRLEWPKEDVRALWIALGGPEKDVADRMLAGLARFPPRHDDFDILDIRTGLAGGYRITVASSTHIRVTLVAEYHQVPGQVHVLALGAGHREAGRMRKIPPKEASHGSHIDARTKHPTIGRSRPEPGT